MRETFNYQRVEKSVNVFWGIVFGLTMIIFPFFYPIGIKGIGGAPIVHLVLAIVGIVLIYGPINRLLKARKTKNVEEPLVVEDGKISYVDVVKGKVEKIVIDMDDIQSRKYDESDGEFTIRTSQGYYKLEKGFFDNEIEFERFRRILRNHLDNENAG